MVGPEVESDNGASSNRNQPVVAMVAMISVMMIFLPIIFKGMLYQFNKISFTPGSQNCQEKESKSYVQHAAFSNCAFLPLTKLF